MEAPEDESGANSILMGKSSPFAGYLYRPFFLTSFTSDAGARN